MKVRGSIRVVAWGVVGCAVGAALAVTLEAQRGGAPRGGAQAPGRGQASPASRRPPQPATAQAYPREQVEAGRTRFGAQCGFCHGRDAAGGESGTDLTRSELVAADVRGDRLRPVVRNGRADKGMPAFSLADEDLASIVAFIHNQQAQAAAASGGRRSVDVADLQTGSAEAGRRYFEGACARCHSPTGDLAGVGKRLEGLQLLQRMLNPSLARTPGSAPPPPTVTVTARNGQVTTGRLAYRDEFTIGLTDAAGWYRSWSTREVTFTVDNPLQAHIDQLGKYTDADMHDVFAYLQSLR